ncbi:MAG TPA: COX15/CtaA family protein [Pseudomonadales bacterium]
MTASLPARPRKPLFWLATLAVPLVFVVIALGAFTRLMDAGLGCPDWPTCYGHVLWPTADHHIEKANQKYHEAPVETDKTWPEQVHRLFASALGMISLLVFFLSLRHSQDARLKRRLQALVALFVMALVVKIAVKVNMPVTATAMHDVFDIIIGLVVLGGFALLALLGRSPRSDGQPLRLPALIVGFVILQGLFGMWTVTLKVWPQVVTIHLLGGFTMAALFWLLSLRLANRCWQLPAAALAGLQRMKKLMIAGLAIVIVQIALGGWTTSNYAAVACPDLPTCQGEWWPAMDFASGFNISQGIGPSYLGGKMDNAARMAIHKAHRIGALVTTGWLLLLVLLLWRLPAAPCRRMAATLLLVLLAQVTLGLANIVFNFPLSVAVAHNGGGALLLLTMLTLLYKTHTATPVPAHD